MHTGADFSKVYTWQLLTWLLEITGARLGAIVRAIEPGVFEVEAARDNALRRWLSESLPRVQRTGTPVWGLALPVSATIFSDLSFIAGPSGRPLGNGLCAPIMKEGNQLWGYVLLFDKDNQFTPADLGLAEAIARLVSTAWHREERAQATAPVLQAMELIATEFRLCALATDTGGRIVWVSPELLQQLGFTGQELTGALPPYPFWPSVFDVLPHLGQTTPEAGETSTVPLRRRDGTVWRAKLRTWHREQEGQGFTVALFQPALEQPPPATTTLLALRPWIERLLAGSQIPAALVSSNGSLVWANDVFVQAAGWVQPRALALLQSLTLEAQARLLAFLRQGPDAGPVGVLQLAQTAGKDGQTRPWTFLCVPLPDGALLLSADEAPALVGRLEVQAYQPAEDWAPCFCFDAHGRITSWDERWRKHVGLEPEDLNRSSVMTLLDWVLSRQNERELVADHMQLLAQTPRRFVVHLGEPDGTETAVYWLIVPQEHPESGRGGLVLWRPYRPPTPLAVDFYRRLAYGLTVLLNHYLSVPVGLAERALDRGDLPPELSASFQAILEACQRPVALISALQDLGTRGPAKLQTFSLGALVRELVEERQREAPFAYTTSVDAPATGDQVVADRRAITVVLKHLLANAEHAISETPTKLIHVRVWPDDGQVWLEVHDTGEGISESDLQSVFLPFWSTKGPFARDSHHAAFDAVGLGLTVAQHLLRLHGAEVELESKPLGGTTVRFALRKAPLRAAVAPSSSSQAVSPMSSGAES
ncbi:MAG: hypothetical protein C4297_02980 [Gemmataceae bacterium]